MGYLLPLVKILVITATVVYADTTCLVQQPRSHPAPYLSSTIVDALNGAASNQKHGICSDFPVLPNGSKSKTIQRSNGSLILKATRHAENVTLGEECVRAFESIIHTCIGQGIYWGGNLTAKNIDYAIYNEAFPKNWVPNQSASPSKANLIHPAATKKTSHKVVPSAKSKVVPSGKSKVVPSGKPKVVPSDKPKVVPSVTPKVVPSVTPKVVPSVKPKLVTPVPVSPHVRPVGTAGSALFSTHTLSGVTGVPGSFSQTKTTDSNGLATILPIWFGVAGAGIILTPLIGGVGGVPPPPLGLPAVDIGPDGIASANSRPQDQTPTESPPSNHHSISTTAHSSSSVSSSRSGASSRISSSTSSAAPKASVWPYVISPKNPHDAANNALTSELQRTFGTDVLVVSNRVSGVLMWSVLMTESQSNTYRNNAVVCERET